MCDHIIFTDDELNSFVNYRYQRHEKVSRGIVTGFVDVYTVFFKRTQTIKANWFRMNDIVKEINTHEEFRFDWRQAIENKETRHYQRDESISFRNYLNGIILFKNKNSQLYEQFEQFLDSQKS